MSTNDSSTPHIGWTIVLGLYLTSLSVLCGYGLVIFWPTFSTIDTPSVDTAPRDQNLLQFADVSHAENTLGDDDSAYVSSDAVTATPQNLSTPIFSQTEELATGRSQLQRSPTITASNLSPLWRSHGPSERLIILIAILAGALGSCLHALQSLAVFIGNRQFRKSWIPWYVLRPFIGTSLALITLFVLGSGLAITGSSSSLDTVDPFGVAAITSLAGMFSKRATEKLDEICGTIFHKRQQGEYQDRIVKRDRESEPG
jgi:hypothetical protein